MLAIRNTFIDVVAEQEDNIQTLRRSASCSSLSHRSFASAWSTSSLLSDWSDASEGHEGYDTSQTLTQQYFRLQNNDVTSQTAVHYTFEDTSDSVAASSALTLSDATASAPRNHSALVEALLHETGLPLKKLMELDEAGTLERIPRNEEGKISSIGSMYDHFEGTCSPCIFWFRGECSNGILCKWCHFQHEGQKNRRYKPNRRVRMARREKASGAGSQVQLQ